MSGQPGFLKAGGRCESLGEISHADAPNPFKPGVLVRLKNPAGPFERALRLAVVEVHGSSADVQAVAAVGFGNVHLIPLSGLVPVHPTEGELRVVVTDERGAEWSRCTLSEFFRDNKAGGPRWSRAVRECVRLNLLTHGRHVFNLGAGGVFTLRPEST